MITGIAWLDALIWIVSFLGFGTLGGSVLANLINKKIALKLDEEREERKSLEKAKLESELLIHEGLCATGHLAEATAIAVKEGKSNGRTDRALEYYRIYRDKEDAFMRRQATERLHEAG